HHPLYAASTTAVSIVVRDSCLELCFFFYSVTDVISNVAKYNTSVKIYLSKSKMTDLKNYLKITKYTKKLLNYSNVSKSNSLLYTSAGNLVQRNRPNKLAKGRRMLCAKRTGIHTDQPVSNHFPAKCGGKDLTFRALQ